MCLGFAQPGALNYRLYSVKRQGFEARSPLSVLEYVQAAHQQMKRVLVTVRFDSLSIDTPLFQFFTAVQHPNTNLTLETSTPGGSYFYSSSTEPSFWYSVSTQASDDTRPSNSTTHTNTVTVKSPRLNLGLPQVRPYVRDAVQKLIERFYVDGVVLDVSEWLSPAVLGSPQMLADAIATMHDLRTVVASYAGVELWVTNGNGVLSTLLSDVAPQLADTQAYAVTDFYTPFVTDTADSAASI